VTAPLPIAFYAPLKSPRHPAASGDRTMARLLLKALAAAGFDPRLASELRTLDKAGRTEEQRRLEEISGREAEDLVARFQALPPEERPRLWFTYHVYYKAPDWIGPRVAEALRIPYCVAEGSRALKRASGPWAYSHAGAEAALDRADVLFVMTDQDREGLERGRRPGQTLVDLPPFLDLTAWASGPAGAGPARPPGLLTVAMMRAGDKLASYRILADALTHLTALPWELDVVGDGEARDEVQRLLAPFGTRIRLHRAVEETERLRSFYAGAHLLAWPAVNEAYGMALLEAQALGCPVVAGAFGGVPSVVRHGETGLLTAPGDPRAFAEAVGRLLADGEERDRLSAGARCFVESERSLDRAAARLKEALLPLIGRIPA
jgi:glycosyltransferase involved in cell wall biosynthesis